LREGAEEMKSRREKRRNPGGERFEDASSRRSLRRVGEEGGMRKREQEVDADAFFRS
jgi:hypothetical protein